MLLQTHKIPTRRLHRLQYENINPIIRKKIVTYFNLGTFFNNKVNKITSVRAIETFLLLIFKISRQLIQVVKLKIVPVTKFFGDYLEQDRLKRRYGGVTKVMIS